ncbi:MAG: restriction endonuclease subunit S [Thaumarchaeota archaeon]|nr:restriction endonuclease subunit S [Nitrososphaerota archaeon]
MRHIIIPTNWKSKKLGDPEVAEIIMGQSPPGSTYNANKVGLPFFQGKTDFGEKYPTPRIWCSKPKKISEKGDILISVRAPVGPTNWTREKCCVGRGLAVIRAKIIPEYIYYYLKFLEPTLLKSGTGSTFKSIGKQYLYDISIPVAPLETQKRIVKKLDCIFTQFEEKKKTILELQEKKLEHISKLTSDLYFDLIQKYVPLENKPPHWHIKKLHEIAEIGQGGTPSRAKPDYWNGSIPWLRSGEILNNHITESREKITESGLKNSSTQLCPKGTILMAMTGQGLTRGRTALLEIDACANQSCAHMINKTKDVITEFLWLFLQSRYWFIRSIYHGSGQPGINVGLIKQLDIPIPPLKEQHNIIEKINDGRRHIESIKLILNSIYEKEEKMKVYLEHIQTAVLTQAFSGKLIN